MLRHTTTHTMARIRHQTISPATERGVLSDHTNHVNLDQQNRIDR